MISAEQSDPIQQAFRALADPTRREILRHLSQREMTIGEVAGHFTMTRAAVKKHLSVLQDGGMISVQPRGRERINKLEPQGMKSVSEWLKHFEQFWDGRLAALHEAIENEERSK